MAGGTDFFDLLGEIAVSPSVDIFDFHFDTIGLDLDRNLVVGPSWRGFRLFWSKTRVWYLLKSCLLLKVLDCRGYHLEFGFGIGL